MTSDISLIKDNLDQYVVRPLNAFGLAGFLFDIELESTVSLKNDITDHFVEDNTSVQDHIAIQPKKITLKNLVGELTDIDESNPTRIFQKVGRKLTTLVPLIPTFTAAGTQAFDFLKSVQTGGVDAILDAELPSTEDLLDLYQIGKNFLLPSTNQAEVYQYFKALRDQKILFSVQTPFEFMTNMAIESLSVTQPRETRFASEFTMTLKEIRFATSEVVEISAEGRTARQGESESNRGTVGGKSSVLFGEIKGSLEKLLPSLFE